MKSLRTNRETVDSKATRATATRIPFCLFVTFFGSVQLLSLSIIGEYVGRIFTQNKGRPLYITSQSINVKPGTCPKLGIAFERSDTRS